MKNVVYVSTVCLFTFLTGCRSPQVKRSNPEAVAVSQDVVLNEIADGVWVHTTYFDVPGYGRCPANGLVVIDEGEALLIDLPWTDELTAVLCEWIASSKGATVRTVLPTHFHEDCMGGLGEAHRRGAESHALDKTVEIARQRGLPIPQKTYTGQFAVRCGDTEVRLRYFGAGHTTDNVVAWLPRKRVLFGGCLVKSLNSRSLGNTKDGDLEAYPETLRKVRAAYPQARVVVPGHGRWGGTELIDHTLSLCTQ